MKLGKRKIIAGIITALLAMSMSVTWGQAYNANMEKPVVNDQGETIGTTRLPSNKDTLQNLPKDYYVIDRQVADVNGDKVEDTIYLVGHKDKKEARYADQMNLLVQDGATKQEIKVDLDKMNGYDATLFMGDFNGNKISDVFVKAPTGGSGGIVEQRIVTFDKGEPEIIFGHEHNNGIQLSGKYVNGFKAELVDKMGKPSVTLDISGQKQKYIREEIYEEDGTLRKAINPITYSMVVEPVDRNADGTYELSGQQRIVGAYGADGIGKVYSIWSYQQGMWKQEQVEVSTFIAQDSGIQTLPVLVENEADTVKATTSEDQGESIVVDIDIH